MPIPQYNVRQTDTGSRNYNQPAFRPAPAPPKINPLKNWWNSIVNNARQNAFSPANTWDTVAPNVPKYNTSTQRTPWDIPYWTPPSVKAPLPQPTYSVFDPFGVPAYGVPQMPTAYGVPQMPTAYGSNTRRGGRVYPTSPNLFNTVNNINRGLNSPFGKPSTYPKPNQNAIGQYTDTDNRNRVLTWDEIAQLPDYGRPPQEEDAYQEGVWVANQEVPAGGYGGGYGGYGGSSYYSMPNSPRYKGYGGGYGSGGSPRSARYQGNYGGYGGGYGGYAGGQSQRSAWYGALLQWNI